MDTIIVQSEELKQKMIGIRDLKKTVVLPVGFNKHFFYPIEKNKKPRLRRLLNVAEKQFLIVYCGVIAKSRQLHILLHALKKVMETFSDVKLLMIGNGDSVETLKILANTLSISQNIIFTGKVSHHDVVNYVSLGDIGISYIPINENYNYNPPLKTFEYLACGLPTIATNTVSNQRIITHTFNGILSNDTPDDIANAIVDLLSDESKRQFLSANARNSIMKNDFENIAKTSLIPLYWSLS
jgi:glycosyltransferase involved in cell wall biosynthesis